jgi:hypothetical protein
MLLIAEIDHAADPATVDQHVGGVKIAVQPHRGLVPRRILASASPVTPSQVFTPAGAERTAVPFRLLAVSERVRT